MRTFLLLAVFLAPVSGRCQSGLASTLESEHPGLGKAMAEVLLSISGLGGEARREALRVRVSLAGARPTAAELASDTLLRSLDAWDCGRVLIDALVGPHDRHDRSLAVHRELCRGAGAKAEPFPDGRERRAPAFAEIPESLVGGLAEGLDAGGFFDRTSVPPRGTERAEAVRERPAADGTSDGRRSEVPLGLGASISYRAGEPRPGPSGLESSGGARLSYRQELLRAGGHSVSASVDVDPARALNAAKGRQGEVETGISVQYRGHAAGSVSFSAALGVRSADADGPEMNTSAGLAWSMGSRATVRLAVWMDSALEKMEALEALDRAALIELIWPLRRAPSRR